MRDDEVYLGGKLRIMEDAYNAANDEIDRLRTELRYATYRIKQLEDERDGIVSYTDP